MPVLLVALAVAATPVRAAGLVKDHERADAEAALERYLSGAVTPSWPVEAVEIHASIPRLAKTGQLQAIRSMDRPDSPRYQILQLSGDGTVKHQVIARYLNVQERASEMTPSVALTLANYKFAYKGIVDDGERFAYAFRISPRKKRDGLIKGEGGWTSEPGPRSADPVIWSSVHRYGSNELQLLRRTLFATALCSCA
jgi:hypothetical protein